MGLGRDAFFAGLGMVAGATPWILQGTKGGGRPMAKELIHKCLEMTDKVKEVAAESGEQLRDLVAEVQAERAGQSRQDEEGTPEAKQENGQKQQEQAAADAEEKSAAGR